MWFLCQWLPVVMVGVALFELGKFMECIQVDNNAQNENGNKIVRHSLFVLPHISHFIVTWWCTKQQECILVNCGLQRRHETFTTVTVAFRAICGVHSMKTLPESSSVHDRCFGLASSLSNATAAVMSFSTMQMEWLVVQPHQICTHYDATKKQTDERTARRISHFHFFMPQIRITNGKEIARNEKLQ